MLNKEYILEQIGKYCTLNEDLCEGTFYEQVVSPLEDANCFENWTYDSGASKGVLIFGDLDYVIKIPFYSEYIEPYEDYNEELDEYEIVEEGGSSGYPFGGIQVEGFIHNNDWDYCETEQYRYIAAERNGVEECFAKTWFLASVCGWPIYAQARACMFASLESHTTRSRKEYAPAQRKRSQEIQNKTKFYVEEEWMIDFINYWGEDKLMDLIRFCDEWFIDDLHRGNIGYICGAPCIVDYSSFNG